MQEVLTGPTLISDWAKAPTSPWCSASPWQTLIEMYSLIHSFIHLSNNHMVCSCHLFMSGYICDKSRFMSINSILGL